MALVLGWVLNVWGVSERPLPLQQSPILTVPVLDRAPSETDNGPPGSFSLQGPTVLPYIPGTYFYLCMALTDQPFNDKSTVKLISDPQGRGL